MTCIGIRFQLPKYEATNISYGSYKCFEEERFVNELFMSWNRVGEIFDDVDDSNRSF